MTGLSWGRSQFLKASSGRRLPNPKPENQNPKEGRSPKPDGITSRAALGTD
jgi:hypothetical protein